jgi:type I restriction enzyme S subunit
MLGDIAKINTGKKDNQDKNTDGKYPFFVRSKNIERINSYSFDGEAILVPGEGKIGEIFHYINGKFDYHQRVYKISDFRINIVSAKYLHQYFKQFFIKEAVRNSVKATVDSLRLPTFTNMNIHLPSFDEQTAIANILQTADKEIELEKAKLEKLKEEKKGLMQRLLIGKKRLEY